MDDGASARRAAGTPGRCAPRRCAVVAQTWFVLLLGVGACAPTSQPSRPGQPAARRDRACGDRVCREAARDYRLGHGVARDHGAAARLLGVGCDHGDGLACAELADAVRGARGVAKDDTRAAQLEQRACTLGDVVSCHEEDSQTLCARGELRACALPDDSYTTDAAELDANRRRRVELCRRGILAACKAVADEVIASCANAPKVCRAYVAEAGPSQRDALSWLAKMCASGDEDGCVLPDDKPSDAQRCRENDFQGCAEQVRLANDVAAGWRACMEGGLADACAQVADLLLHGRRDRTTEARAAAERWCALAGQTSCEDPAQRDFATGCWNMGVERLDPASRPRFASRIGAAARMLPSGRGLVVVSLDHVDEDNWRTALATISPGVGLVAVSASPAGLFPGGKPPPARVTDIRVNDLVTVFQNVRGQLLVVDASGLIRGSISDPFWDSLGRCVDSLLAEP